MNTMTRKEREFQERQELLLDIGAKMLVERGFAGMTMDRIAEIAEYSKGTIYQHFTCKEDIVLALHNRNMGMLGEMFRRATLFDGNTREKLIAVGAAYDWFLYSHPYSAITATLIHTTLIREKSSEKQLEEQLCAESGAMAAIHGCIREAIQLGDLNLRQGQTPEQLGFGLWAVSLGVYTILAKDFDLKVIDISDPLNDLHQIRMTLIDGYGWRPLTTEFDYKNTLERIHKELIPVLEKEFIK